MKTKTSSANVIFADYPDPDVIRVDDAYYMVSTTMHFMPGCVILRSYNLVDWEIASYVYEELDNTMGQRLWDDKGIYGQGMWAACIRYHKGKFYICFVANDTHKTYLFTSDSINGPWQKNEIQGFYHDMSLLFDEDENGTERVFVVSGNTQITLTELNSDLSGPKKDGISKVIITDTSERILGFEGSHFYKINGRYYIFLIHWPKNKFRTEACYVSDKIDGPYKGCDVLCSDLGNWSSGVAQGGIVQTPDGKWFGLLFQDHGALGRIPVLVPVTFENDFPVFRITENVTVPDLRPDYKYAPLWNDNFTKDGKLLLTWQWNHIPSLKYVKADEKSLTLTTNKVCCNVCHAANTLTQRPLTERFSAEVSVEFSKLCEGDYAGVAALEGDYSNIAVTKKDGKYKFVLCRRKTEVEPFKIGSVDRNYAEEVAVVEAEVGAKARVRATQVRFKISFDFTREGQKVTYYYKTDAEEDFIQLGEPQGVRFTLDQFVGCRFALYIYSTQKAGGSVTFTDVNAIHVD